MTQRAIVFCTFVAFAAFVAAAFVGAFSCTPFQKQVVRNALTASDFACIIANAMLDNEDIARVCQINRDLRPVMDDLLKHHRAAVVRQMKKGCGTSVTDPGFSTDAGTD